MRILLSLMLLGSMAALAATPMRVSVQGLQNTTLDFVWQLKVKETGWSGKLDCQSFFHNMRVSYGGQDTQLFLDAGECEDWRDKLEKASIITPSCLNVTASGITATGC